MEDKIEMLEKTGLNWKVNKEPIQTVSGLEIPGKIALVRDDTQKILGIHGNSYEPYQNEELLELLYKIGESTGLKLHTGGCFKGGDKVWFQLKSNDLKLGNDTIKGYVSGFNSFDGKTALAFGNSSTTVSCMNTFWRGYKEVATRLRHSSLMRPRIEEILAKINVLMDEEKVMFEEIKRLHNADVTPEIQELIMRKLFDISVEERLDYVDGQLIPKIDSELSSRKKNQIWQFNSDLKMENYTKGENLWGLFSGITRYTTHSMKRGDNSEAKMFGRTGTLERRLYNELVEMT